MPKIFSNGLKIKMLSIKIRFRVIKFGQKANISKLNKIRNKKQDFLNYSKFYTLLKSKLISWSILKSEKSIIFTINGY